MSGGSVNRDKLEYSACKRDKTLEKRSQQLDKKLRELSQNAKICKTTQTA